MPALQAKALTWGCHVDSLPGRLIAFTAHVACHRKAPNPPGPRPKYPSGARRIGADRSGAYVFASQDDHEPAALGCGSAAGEAARIGSQKARTGSGGQEGAHREILPAAISNQKER